MHNDSDAISYREAVSRFATRDEVATVTRRVDDLVPRREHELRWQVDDERWRWVTKQLEGITEDVRQLREAKLPRWVIPLLAILAPIAAVVISHYWR